MDSGDDGRHANSPESAIVPQRRDRAPRHSFSHTRNGRLDVAILGACQVAANGDLANWRLPGAKTGNIGGAMDLAAGARQVWVMMTHVDKDGRLKIVEAVTCPVTA
jgi:3-oxoacid CoA-transferase B subunit